MNSTSITRKNAKSKTRSTKPGILVTAGYTLRPCKAVSDAKYDGDEYVDGVHEDGESTSKIRGVLYTTIDKPATVILRQLARWDTLWANDCLGQIYAGEQNGKVVGVRPRHGAKPMELLDAVLANITAKQPREQRNRVLGFALRVARLYPSDLLRDEAINAIYQRYSDLKLPKPRKSVLRAAVQQTDTQRSGGDGGPAMRLAAGYLQSLLWAAGLDREHPDRGVVGLLRHGQRWLAYDEDDEQYHELPDHELRTAVMRYVQSRAGGQEVGPKEIDKYLVVNTIANLEGMVETIPATMSLPVWIGDPVADLDWTSDMPHPDELTGPSEQNPDDAAAAGDDEDDDDEEPDEDEDEDEEPGEDEEDDAYDDDEGEEVTAEAGPALRQSWQICPAVTMAVQNGRLWLPDDDEPKLLLASRRHVSMAPLGCEFLPGATCPKWRAFIERRLPREGKHDHRQEILQQFLGWTLTGSHGKGCNKGLFLCGEKGSGKSQVLDILKAILGRANYSALTMEQLGDKFNLSRMEHVLANICADTRYITKMDEGILKTVISGEDQQLEDKYIDPRRGRITAKQIMATNLLPRFSDPGTWDRLILLPFTERIRDTPEQIIDFAKTHLFDELPGILNWYIEGLQQLAQAG